MLLLKFDTSHIVDIFLIAMLKFIKHFYKFSSIR